MSLTSALVTVIMPCYNYASYIPAAIESVREQTFSEWHLIIVNDGSTDNTVTVLQDYAADPNITIINKQNAGVSAARNTGLDMAKSEYVAFLDADDVWLPTKLEHVINAMQDNNAKFGASDFGRFSSSSENFGNFLSYCEQLKKRALATNQSLVFAPALPVFTETLEMPWYPSANIVHRDFYEHERFDESMKLGEDLDYFIRCWILYPGVFVCESLLKLRVHDSNASKSSVNHILLVLKLFDKHSHSIEDKVQQQYLSRRIHLLLGHQQLLKRAVSDTDRNWLKNQYSSYIFAGGVGASDKLKLVLNYVRLTLNK